MPRMDKLSTYCTTVANTETGFVVTYHSTPIVTVDGDLITLKTGGWDTVTTRRKMNQAARQFGLRYSVYRKAGTTYVDNGFGLDFPLGEEAKFWNAKV